MNRNIRSEQITQLKTNGFKVVKGYSFLYINEIGEVFSLKKGTALKPNSKNLILVDSKYINVPKLILEAFKGLKPNKGQIVYIDGNKSNLNVNNLSYARLFVPCDTVKVNDSDLMTAIRCYFEVEKRFKVSNYFLAKFYLRFIAEKRGFFDENCSVEHNEVYKMYLNGKSISKTAKSIGLGYRDCGYIVNKFTNNLLSSVLNDLQSGILQINEYKQKKKTKRQTLKEWEAHKNEIEQLANQKRQLNEVILLK